MKRIFTSVLSLMFCSLAFAQVSHKEAGNEWCGEIVQFERDVMEHPELKEKREAFMTEMSNIIEANKVFRANENQKVIIPVVFHILHDEGSGNITKAQIEKQIAILNKDFNRLNSDTVNTPVPFRQVAGKLNVEFRLAKLDPAGRCTEGIVRANSKKTNGATNQNGAKGVSYWNSYSYLNFWVVETIGLKADGNNIVLGYAQFPESGLLSTDGVVLRNDRTGDIGTANGQKGRTATHEVGHWLNLIHIWGDAECGNDQVQDTPNHYQPNYGVCYDDYPYVYLELDEQDDTVLYNPCNVDPAIGEMMVNYMDYSSDHCMNMFTQGQVERMKATLFGTSGTNGPRSRIWSEENLWATGTHDDYVEQDCPPIADFVSSKKMICTGNSINFDDISYNGDISSVNWTFSNGSPSSSTSSSPSVTYNTPGKHQVSLQVSNAQGNDTETKTDYIIVSDPSAAFNNSWTYWEAFGSPDDFEDWIVINYDGKEGWELASNFETPDHWGAVRMESYDATPGEIDELISPAYNLSVLDNPVLKFNYTSTTRLEIGQTNFGPNDGDVLKIFVSTNCGATWQLRTTIDEYDLINSGLESDAYVPWSGSIWTERQVTLPSGIQNSDNVRFKFEYTSGGFGNNFYLDNIYVQNPTSVEELEKQFGMSVYPNPTDNAATLSFEMPANEQVSIVLNDITGRQVSTIYNGSLQQGKYNFNIDLSNVDAGLYLLNVQYKGTSFSKKIMVK